MTNENNLNLTEMIREIHDGVAKEMYCKAIDDFAESVKNLIADSSVIRFKDIDEIAEQLKGSASCVSNDVCEWKLEDDNLITSCGDYFNLYDNCTEKFKYCPRCGRKIKVVE